MTNSLPSRLAKLAEFDESRLEPLKGWPRTVFMNGMLTENARLQPLISALIECAEALQDCDEWFQDHSGGDEDEPMQPVHQEVFRLLARLEALAKDVK